MNSFSSQDGIIYFIVNPVSGNGKTLKIIPKIIDYLSKNQIKYEIVHTEYKNHAVEIAKQSKKNNNIKMIVAVGGDGTLHEIVNGLYPSEIPLGYIPAGTGNDFAREMDIPRDPIQALKRVLKMQTKKIDLGKINDHYFINVTSMGFDGEVAKTANQSKLKHIFGRLVYIYGIIKVLLTFRPKEITLVVDDKVIFYKNVWLIAIANNRFYGGGMEICPKAVNDDGEFDICVIKDLSHFQFLRLFPTIFSGKHINLPYVDTIRVKRIEVKTNEELTIQSDGEILGNISLRLKIIKQGLNVIY